MASDVLRPEKDQLAREIMAYLTEHPDSRDTLEGIVQWWLLERRINTDKCLATSALYELIARGLVYKVSRGASTAEYYCINKDKQDEIAKLLKIP